MFLLTSIVALTHLTNEKPQNIHVLHIITELKSTPWPKSVVYIAIPTFRFEIIRDRKGLCSA